jgi:two-component system alkaline phosphatase synthesis response regulator PhoP
LRPGQAMTNRLDKLIQDLGSLAWEVHRRAMKKLVEVGPRAVEPLIAVLDDDDSRVRTRAIEALGRIGDARAVEPLVDGLGDRGWQVREKAADALGILGDARAVEPLIDILSLEDDWIVLGATIRALMKLDDSRAVRALEEFSAHVLIADDEPDFLELISFVLRFAGFTGVAARDGEQAIEIAVAIRPRLVLLDVRMPRLTGYEACRRLRKLEATAGIPVVFLSAKGQEAEIKQGLDSGAVEYIVKPFAPDELTSQIKDILRRLEIGIYEED